MTEDNKKTKKSVFVEFIAAATILTVLIFLIRISGLDLKISDRAHQLTAFKSGTLMEYLAWIGKYLSILFAALAMLLLIKKRNENHPFKKELIFALLLLFIGPFLINNFLLKPFFKRPRPQQIIRYQAESQHTFVPAFNSGTDTSHKSFPSGHAGAAFFFIFPWFCYKYRQRFGLKLFLPGLCFGLLTGSLRILVGKHFLSDILASLMLVYLTGLVLAYLVFRKDTLEESSKT